MHDLQNLLHGLKHQLGADHLAMLIYAPHDRMQSAAIFESGDGAPVVEMQSVENASVLINGALSIRRTEVLPSGTAGGHLICVPNSISQEGRRSLPGTQTYTWFGLRGMQPDADQLRLLQSIVPMCASYFAQSHFHTDALTGLAGRGRFEQELAGALNQRRATQSELALLLMSPLEVSAWNSELGRSRADLVLAEVASLLSTSLRDTDLLCRYGGATFGLLLPGLSEFEVRSLADQIAARFARAAVDAGVQATLCIGGCWVGERAEVERYTFVNNADCALRHAKLSGDGVVQVFSAQDLLPQLAQDPLDGIFSGQVDSDYRSMRLLWSILQLSAQEHDAAALLARGIETLIGHFDLLAAGAWLRMDQQWRIANGSPESEHQPPLQWLDSALEDEQPQTRQQDGREVLIVHVSQNQIQTKSQGMVFWFQADQTGFAATDATLLQVLLPLLVKAVGTAVHVSEQLATQAAENERLHETVQRIQHRDSGVSFLFKSAPMQALLTQAQAMAETDNTVLITGESGTGKEVIARSLHEMSHLAEQPLVIVDCAAIPSSLFEAELFGRTKGAYTSAESASEGYIGKAEGGTLFLDEIGELPLDVQAKLLRFLQEKEIRPVGASTTRQVDVRVIAATNRNLEAEVEAQRFRRDLYHRLCVLHLHIPPLRERRADILVLAQHFVASYAKLHGKKLQLTPAAERALVQNTWQGNVRELQHCLLRAVLLGENEVIDVDALELRAETMTSVVQVQPSAAHGHAVPPALVEDPLGALAENMSRIVQDCVDHAHKLPLGSWLVDDLVDLAYQRAGMVIKRAADLLGVAETTYRRHLERVQQEIRSGLRVRNEAWQTEIEPLLSQVMESYATVAASASLLKEVKLLSMRVVSTLLADDHKTGAALVGVSLPTYRRYLSVEEDAA